MVGARDASKHTIPQRVIDMARRRKLQPGWLRAAQTLRARKEAERRDAESQARLAHATARVVDEERTSS